MNVEFLGEAEDDVDLGILFYKKRDLWLGMHFLDSVQEAVLEIKLKPAVHSVHFGCYRRKVHRFPHAIFYLCEESLIRVIAVLDLRRSPSTIRSILSNRKSGTGEY